MDHATEVTYHVGVLVIFRIAEGVPQRDVLILVIC